MSDLPQLNKQLIPELKKYDHLPERIIQFGEGNFLRGFIDWMIQRLNEQDLFNGLVVAIQPTPYGKVVPKLNIQNGLYTLVLQGVEQGKDVEKIEVISSISRGINPYDQWSEVLKVAENKEIKFVFSNTTEAGLTYMEEEYFPDRSPFSYPGKLTAFLYHRYKIMSGTKESGLYILPCELVEENGIILRELVVKMADHWELPQDFISWVTKANFFYNTLVDRIVTGYPKDRINDFRIQLGYEDKLLTVGEPYHLFAIEGDGEIINKIPFHKAGLNVYWEDITPFKELKVRILNGAHTLMFATGYLYGVDTVIDVMECDDLLDFVNRGIYKEILPVIEQPQEQKSQFANAVIERFRNPYSKHYILDIGMNAIPKFKARLLQTILDSIKNKKHLPPMIVFSLASLIAFYHGKIKEDDFMVGKRGDEEYIIRDNIETLQFFEEVWKKYSDNLKQLVMTILSNQALWSMDLNEIDQLSETVYIHLKSIIEQGMKTAVKQVIKIS
jgi:tagaturonate reductase